MAVTLLDAIFTIVELKCQSVCRAASATALLRLRRTWFHCTAAQPKAHGTTHMCLRYLRHEHHNWVLGVGIELGTDCMSVLINIRPSVPVSLLQIAYVLHVFDNCTLQQSDAHTNKSTGEHRTCMPKHMPKKGLLLVLA